MTDSTLSLQIELLADHPEAISVLQACFEQEWGPYYGLAGPGNAQEDLRTSCNRDKLPITLIAVYEGEVCGTAALKVESVSTHKYLTPWLAALLVSPAFRRRGVGEQLIAAIEEKPVSLGTSISTSVRVKDLARPNLRFASAAGNLSKRNHILYPTY